VLLWVLSDLHLESTRGWNLAGPGDRPRFDVLVVAGDLIPKMERGVAFLLERVTDKQVIVVAGNHEFYGCDIDRTVDKARALAAGTNVHVLQNDTVTIDGVTFIGATFWTDFALFGDPVRAMAAAAEYMNDYRKIRLGRYAYRLRPSHTLARHKESRAFIAAELAKPKTGARVVVTHMAPHPSAIHSAFDEEITSAAYASDCSDLMAMGVDAWIHGHTHATYDRLVAVAGTGTRPVRLVTNAKGYGPWPPKELTSDNKDFDPMFVIEI
jgi:Icc-related predicted phosphoesterase